MAIGLSVDASRVLANLKRQHGLGDDWGLRVRYDRAAQGAARYQLELEPGPAERDRSWVIAGLAVFCDPKSFLMLGDVTVHYDSDRAGFVVLEHG
jgi:Fe-S cluster assembly iron-binding protein IscA